MNKVVLLNGVYLALGVFLGFVLFSPAENMNSGPFMTPENNESMNMAEMQPHPMIAVDESLPIPSIKVEAIKDMMDGYNLHFVLENYVFTPEKVNTEPISNEGHTHVYVNGVKVARVYGEWFHLSSNYLKEGEHTVEVTLNANDHSEWMYESKHISAKLTVVK